MGKKNKNYLVMFIILSITLLGLLLLVFRHPELSRQMTVTLAFLLISLIIAVGAYANLSWTFKLSSIYFVVFLINVVYLAAVLGNDSYVLGAVALIAALGFLFSAFNLRKKSPPKVEVVNYNKKKSAKKHTPAKKFSPGKFVASATGSVYHAPKCDWAKRIQKKKQVWFNTKGEATKKGYKAHSCLQ